MISSTPQTTQNPQTQGFTLIEVLVVVVIIGVLAGIAGPSWIGWVTQQRINATNGAIISAIEKARNDAQAKKVPQTVAFRVIDGIPQVAVFPAVENDELDANARGRLNNLWQQGQVTGVNPGEVLLMTNLAGENKLNDDGASVLPATTPASSEVKTIASKADNNSFWTSTGNKLPKHRITFDHNGILSGDNPDAGLMILVSMPTNADRNNGITETTKPIASKIRCVRVGTLIGGLQLGRSANDCNRMRQGEED
ncbi:MAG: prepilin-type N-terminal cleavage/methylation domain-containing protein [Spirulina sp. DLM2.Bin59]|nr:MAG: prepilin-type N-terminal cleavage/methylation domain-containing protein [Spirulina sp. DLM2.Bin59]